jgi:hypothetical protein
MHSTRNLGFGHAAASNNLQMLLSKAKRLEQKKK